MDLFSTYTVVCALWITTFHFQYLLSTCVYEKFDLWSSELLTAFIPKLHCDKITCSSPENSDTKIRAKKRKENESKRISLWVSLGLIPSFPLKRMLSCSLHASAGSMWISLQYKHVRFVGELYTYVTPSDPKSGLLLGIFASF